MKSASAVAGLPCPNIVSVCNRCPFKIILDSGDRVKPCPKALLTSRLIICPKLRSSSIPSAAGLFLALDGGSEQSDRPDTFRLRFRRQAWALGEGPFYLMAWGDDPLFAVDQFSFGIFGVINCGDHSFLDRGQGLANRPNLPLTEAFGFGQRARIVSRKELGTVLDA